MYKKSYVDKDGYTHIPIKLKGRKRFRCIGCGKKVRETILETRLCRKCYCESPESLVDLFKLLSEGNDNG